MTFAVVILAGGEGRRIGGGKPLRVLGGVTLLERAQAQARRWSNRVALALRERAQLGGVEMTVVEDDARFQGPLGGLASALRFGTLQGVDAVLTIPSDMPFLPRDLPQRLAREITGNLAAIASSGGRLHPVCGLWRIDALDRLEGYAASGRRSLKGFAAAVGYAVVDWRAEPLDPFFNINSRDDLEQAEAMLEA